MAIEKKLIHFGKLADFETQLKAGNILDYSIVFIQDAKKIWTHGSYYDCSGAVASSDKYVIEDFTLEDIYDIGITEGTLQFPVGSIYDAIDQGKTIAIDCGYAGGGQAIAITSVIDDFGYLYFIDVYNKKEVFLQIEHNAQEIPFEISEHITSKSIANTYTPLSKHNELGALVSTKQTTLISGTNIKTINGTTILGSGNIAITPITSMRYSTPAANIPIPMNTAKVITSVTSTNQTFTLATGSLVTNPASITQEQKWEIVFAINNSLSTAPTITFNTGNVGTIYWINGEAPTFEVGKFYEVSFLNAGGILLGVCAEFSAAS